MSSGGQIAGGVIGGIAGFFIPGAGVALGAQLGMMVGGLLDPPKGPTIVGPRLSDLTIQTSTYGAVIPRVYGTVPLHGNVFWLENNRIYETVVKKKSGGKGGSKTKTKTYVNYATFAVGLCKGPIVGVKRIWIKGELYYDAGSSDHATIAASNAAASGFTLHLGTDTQQPDTRMQATLGAANTPAYRGIAYIVFNDLPLAAYGETIAGAQVKVEVVCNGTISNYVVTQTSISNRNWSALTYNGTVFCAFGYGTNICSTSYDGITWTERTLPKSANWYSAASNSKIIVACSYGSICTSEDNGVTWVERTMPSDWYCTDIVWNGEIFLITTDSGPFFTSTTGKSWAQGASPTAQLGYGNMNYTASGWNGSVFVTIATGGSNGFYYSKTGLDGSWARSISPVGNNWTGIGTLGSRFCVTSSNYAGTYISDDGINWTYNASNFPGSGSVVSSDGAVFCATSYGNYCISADGVTWEIKPFPGGAINAWNGLVWGGAVFVAVRGTGGGSGLSAIIQPYKIAVSTTSLSNIVSSEALQSGLLLGDLTTTALTSAVRGYTVASVGSIRAALTPLQAAWPFDVMQKGYKITFVPRGGASVATIPMTDLDARGDGDSPGVQVTLSREMDTQLPRRLVIKHLDYDREFDQGEQYAERLNTDAVNIETQELPIVLTAAEAAGKAEVLLYVRWLERFDLSFSLPPTYINLEPSDVITLETPEGNVSVRLTAINYTSDGRLECKGKYANQAIYTPAALGVASAVTGPATITSSGSSTYILLDVPYLHTVQADPCFLAAMYGGTGWPGGVLVRTDDSGTTWNDLQGFEPPGSDVGSATNTIGTVDSRTWDKASVLNVTMSNGSLSSVTELAVLNGENYFAYGDHGRWEIIGVQNCTLVSDVSYTLYDMLRGRAGTEWAMGLHQIGDRVVSLNLTDVTAIGMAVATIGASREYRGITYDQGIDSDSDYPFTYAGVNLECLAPVYAQADRSPATGNWDLKWVRRSRTDGEWRDKVDAGVGETTEAYEIDVFSDETYSLVKRVLYSNTQSYIYTASEQVADFGASQTSFYGKVYQMSSVVGRGYPTAFGSVTPDPYFDLVVFLTSNTGLNNATQFSDVKGSTMTAFGNAKTSTLTSPFGLGSSAEFDGVGDYVRTPGLTRHHLGSGQFCIEIVFKTTDKSCVLIDFYSGASNAWQLLLDSSGYLQFYTSSAIKTGAINVSTGNWTYAAITRDSGNLIHFFTAPLGSTLVEDGTGVSNTVNFNSTTTYLALGAQVTSRNASYDFSGNIGPVRITAGTSRGTLSTPTTDFPHA